MKRTHSSSPSADALAPLLRDLACTLKLIASSAASMAQSLRDQTAALQAAAQSAQRRKSFPSVLRVSDATYGRNPRNPEKGEGEVPGFRKS
jgi:hypothetical protein